VIGQLIRNSRASVGNRNVFYLEIFLPRSAAAAISANNQLRTAKIRKRSSRVMAGHQARSAVFA
jgi:hypothetical protein